ncbi:MAG: nuclear transport factor 2 family protein [Acidimicrobiia bacterium]
MTDWTDHQAIVEVTLAYAWSLDSGNWDGLDAVFTPNASADLLGRRSEGRAAIAERVRSSLAPFDSTQHIVTNHQIEVSGDTAHCRCYLQAQHIRKGAPGGDYYIIAGRYEDDLLRTSDGWRIDHRLLAAMWTEGNAAISGGS